MFAEPYQPIAEPNAGADMPWNARLRHAALQPV